MFGENNDYLQGSLSESNNWMNMRIKAEFIKSRAPTFYEYVFCNNDKTPFPVMRSDIGRQTSFPGIISVC